MSDYGAPPPPPPYGAPPPMGQPAGGPPPANNLVWAILSTVFCCLPLGIASIVFSSQVNTKWAQGDFAGAQDSARKAKQFAIWGAVAGLVFVVLYVIFIVIIGIGASQSSN